MLTNITISNFTIIENLSIDLQNGFTTLTGETGAGKSIWVDAVKLALGERADPGSIRHGENRCEITLNFDLSDLPQAQQWLSDQDFEDTSECIIYRRIDRDGKSRSLLNDRSITLSTLKQFSSLVINIASQHQHQNLLQSAKQCQTLDTFSSNQDILDKIKNVCLVYQDHQRQLDALQNQNLHPQDKIQFLEYQLTELENLNLQVGEWEKLDTRHKTLYNAQDIAKAASMALNFLSEAENSSQQSLSKAHALVQPLEKCQKEFANANKLLQKALIYADEAASDLKGYLRDFQTSPDELQQIESRLTAIYDLARKHHTKPEQLPLIQQKLSEELHALQNRSGEISQLQSHLSELYKQYQTLAKRLTNTRQIAAKQLSIHISEKMQLLGMTGGQFEIQLLPQRSDQPNLGGNEKVQFAVSCNPGQPIGLLSKVASGGELSRISLAIQVITASQKTIPTMIFDEVDVGIGGETGHIIANLLLALSKMAQVLCITHLAQVASKAEHHLKVRKQTLNNTTKTFVKTLNRPQRIVEIARMLGGNADSQASQKAAVEMLAS